MDVCGAALARNCVSGLTHVGGQARRRNRKNTRVGVSTLNEAALRLNLGGVWQSSAAAAQEGRFSKRWKRAQSILQVVRQFVPLIRRGGRFVCVRTIQRSGQWWQCQQSPQHVTESKASIAKFFLAVAIRGDLPAPPHLVWWAGENLPPARSTSQSSGEELPS